MPAKKDINVVKGDTLVVPLTFSTLVNATTKAPIDLTGSILVFEATFAENTITLVSNDPEPEENPTGTFQILDAVAGKAELVVRHNETETWPSGGVVYRISRFIDGRKRTFMRGTLKIDGWPHA